MAPKRDPQRASRQGREDRRAQPLPDAEGDEGHFEEEPEGEDLFDDNVLGADYGSGSGDSSSEGPADEAAERDSGEDDFIVDDDDASEGGAEGDGGFLDMAGLRAVGRIIEERDRLRRGGAAEDDDDGSLEEIFGERGRGRGRGGAAPKRRRDGDESDAGSDRLGAAHGEHSSGEDELPLLQQGLAGDRGRRLRGDPEGAAAAYARQQEHATKIVREYLGIDELPAASPATHQFALEDDIYLNEHLASQVPFDWTRPQGSVGDWLNQEIPRRVVKNRIFFFLSTYSRNPDERPRRYYFREALHAMTQSNQRSLEMPYWDLGAVYGSTLALWLADVPEQLIELLEEAASYLLYRILYPNYYRVHRRIFVRLSQLPVCDPIRDFRQVHMNVIVRVEGVVIRRSPVYPQMQSVKYDCGRCSYVIGPIAMRGDKEIKVTQCPSCHSKGPFPVNMALTEYRNHQTVALQEPPGKVPPGRLPRSVEVVLTNDLIDRVKPGEEVEVTGVYKNSFDPVLNSKQGFPVFTTTLHANNICRHSAASSGEGGGGASGSGTDSGVLADAEREQIIQLASHPKIKQKLLRSVAPSIHGRDDIKLGLLLSLLGGVPKDVGGDQSHRIRGDINVLLVGDPGCAKSQFLKYVEMTADRAVFTTGRGSTAVGLTASVSKDTVTGDFVLEGGALVIADKGVCLIDEFDKMSDQDRTSIHEAMEQQTISVARGGIVTTLSARCSIIAAANPLGGRYDPSLSFDANVNLTTPILSRFDVLFVVRDEINAESDARLAKFICESHFKNHPRTRQEAVQHRQARDSEISELRGRYQELTDAAQQLQHAGESQGDASVAETLAAVEAEKEQIALAITEIRQQEAAANAAGSTIVEDLDCNSPNPLPQAVLRKYIYYARNFCVPRVVNIDGNIITRVFGELRQESRHGGLPITVRHLESLIRLTEAHARLHLRDYATNDDVNAAVGFFLDCFLQTQKFSARKALSERFRKYVDLGKEPVQLLHYKLRDLIHRARQFEFQLNGAQAMPVDVEIDASELDGVAESIGLDRETVWHYYNSPTFAGEYVLIKDRGGFPSKIRHTAVPNMP